MPDYAKTVIYQLESSDFRIKEIYGGHTTHMVKRKQLHKTRCNNPNDPHYNAYVYQFIRANGGWSNWKMVWQYNYPCKNKREAEKEETKFIKEKQCELNSNIPYVTEKKKKKKKKQAKKEYYKKLIENETEEEKAERLKKASENSKIRYAEIKANETPEERQERLAKKNKRDAEIKANETPEETQERLAKQRKRDAEISANRTPEEKEQRNTKRREKIKCAICDVFIIKTSIRRHEKTTKHLEKLKAKLAEAEAKVAKK